MCPRLLRGDNRYRQRKRLRSNLDDTDQAESGTKQNDAKNGPKEKGYTPPFQPHLASDKNKTSNPNRYCSQRNRYPVHPCPAYMPLS